jgi:hypothetical protein
MIDKTLARMIDETLHQSRKCLALGGAKCLKSL